ncbi:MAG: VanZ family protein [Dethiobacteria bacterium]
MRIIKPLAVFVASCIFYFWFYPRILFDYIFFYLGRYGYLIQHPSAAIFFILTASIVTLLLYLQFSRRRFLKSFLYSFYFVYILLLGAILFGRNYAFRAIELNPLAFISYLGQPQGSLENFMNILLFVPIGVLFHRFPPKRLSPLTLIGILIIETIQYITCSGVFDLSDLLLNSAGVYLGVSLGGYITQKKGVFVVNSLEEIKADIKNNVEHGDCER